MLLLLLTLLTQDEATRARALVEKLGSESLEERDEAQRALKQMGKAALPALEAASRLPDKEAAGRAAFLVRRLTVLEKLTPELRTALPGVEDRLAAGSHPWTLAFLEATGNRGGTNERPYLRREDLEPLAVPALRGALTPDERATVCERIASAGLTVAARAVLGFLEDPDVSVRLAAGLALGRLGYREGIPQLLVLLKSPEASLRRTGIYVLADLGCREAVPAFRDLLKDADPDVRINAAWAAGYLKDAEAVPGLVKLVRDDDDLVRQNAVWALGELGSWKAVPDFEKLLEDEADEVRAAAARVLGRGQVQEAVPALLKRLKDPDDSVRAYAAEALARCHATVAGPDLQSLLKDDVRLVRKHAARALGELKVHAAVSDLLPLLSDPEVDVRADAAEALGRLKASSAVPQVIRLFTPPADPAEEDSLDPTPEYLSESRSRAWVAMGSGSLLGMGGTEDQVISPEHVVRSFLRLLGQGGGFADLLPLLQHPRPKIRRIALQALGDLEPRERSQAVLPLLKDGDPNVRVEAALTLGRWGRKEALPDLLALHRDSKADLGHYLIWPLLRQDPDTVVRELTPDLEGAVGRRREVAAEIMAALGRREVREAFVGAGGCSFFHNALRQPKEWARLLNLPGAGLFRGTRAERLDRLAQAAGVKVEWSPSALKELDGGWSEHSVREVPPGPGTSLLEALWELLGGQGEPILEPGVWRVLTREEAEQFWQAWTPK